MVNLTHEQATLTCIVKGSLYFPRQREGEMAIFASTRDSKAQGLSSKDDTIYFQAFQIVPSVHIFS
jgi:hypothetical protein